MTAPTTAHALGAEIESELVDEQWDKVAPPVPITHARALELLGVALHRFQIARELLELRRSGAEIRIWRSGGPLRLGTRGQWHVRIRRHEQAEVHVSRISGHGGDVRDQLDNIAHAIQAVS